jgi:hypothetical protein
LANGGESLRTAANGCKSSRMAICRSFFEVTNGQNSKLNFLFQRKYSFNTVFMIWKRERDRRVTVALGLGVSQDRISDIGCFFIKNDRYIYILGQITFPSKNKKI